MATTLSYGLGGSAMGVLLGGRERAHVGPATVRCVKRVWGKSW